jgi:tripartite motif-containing protein 71
VKKAVLSVVLMSGVVASFAPAAASQSLTYVRTIGGPGHAEMYPSGLDVDSTGNVYVADTGNDRVTKYSPSGTLIWSMGTRGGRLPGVFTDPRDVAYLAGRLYVADTGFSRVQVLDASSGAFVSQWTGFGTILGITAGRDAKGAPLILVTEDKRNRVGLFKPSGSLVRYVGSGPGIGPGQLNLPRDAATDSRGNIYVANYANDRIEVFDPSGIYRRSWGTKGSEDGQFRRPYGIAVDATDTVYVADSDNERIQKFTTLGEFRGKMGSSGTGLGQFLQLRRVAVGSGPTPAVYGADLFGFKLERFSASGTFVRRYGGTPPPDGLFNEASGVAVAGSQTFVVDTVNQRIVRYGNGTFERQWGDRGWGQNVLGFNWPLDIATAPVTASVWLADTRNSKLKEFTTDGVSTGRILGGFGTAVGQLNWPAGVAAMGTDLLVADTANDRVERWNPTTRSVVWAVGGFSRPRDVTVSGGVVYVADTLASRIVRLAASDGRLIDSFGIGTLHQPGGVAVDPLTQRVWVADTNWNRLFCFAPDGTLLGPSGNVGTAHGLFRTPTKIEISGNQLFVADSWNDRVEVFALG